MNSHITKSIAAAGIALTLGACASLPGAHTALNADKLASVHAGLSEAEVRTLMGRAPNVTRNPRTAQTLWIYDYTDTWGYDSEFDVEFDANGVVTDTFTQELRG
jgi:hypothetical protein